MDRLRRPAGDDPSTLSFTDVEYGRFPAEAVRGKVVVVGGTAPSLQDLHETSTTTGGLMPGPEIHANAIATALRRLPAARRPRGGSMRCSSSCSPSSRRSPRCACAWPGRWRSGSWRSRALLVGAQLAFDGGTIVTVVYPLVAGIAALAATAAIHGVTVAFERASTRDAFARFVPESVVDQVLQDADGVRLGGVRGEATVMFSDLRGFTSFAETLEPSEVIARSTAT